MRTKRKFRQKGRTNLKSVMERVLKSDKYNFDSDTGLLVHKVKQHKGTFYTSLSGDYHVVRESIFYGIGLMYVNPEKNAPIVSKLIRLTACGRCIWRSLYRRGKDLTGTGRISVQRVFCNLLLITADTLKQV